MGGGSAPVSEIAAASSDADHGGICSGGATTRRKSVTCKSSPVSALASVPNAIFAPSGRPGSGGSGGASRWSNASSIGNLRLYAASAASAA